MHSFTFTFAALHTHHCVICQVTRIDTRRAFVNLAKYSTTACYLTIHHLARHKSLQEDTYIDTYVFLFSSLYLKFINVRQGGLATVKLLHAHLFKHRRVICAYLLLPCLYHRTKLVTRTRSFFHESFVMHHSLSSSLGFHDDALFKRRLY